MLRWPEPCPLGDPRPVSCPGRQAGDTSGSMCPPIHGPLSPARPEGRVPALCVLGRAEASLPVAGGLCEAEPNRLPMGHVVSGGSKGDTPASQSLPGSDRCHSPSLSRGSFWREELRTAGPPGARGWGPGAEQAGLVGWVVWARLGRRRLFLIIRLVDPTNNDTGWHCPQGRCLPEKDPTRRWRGLSKNSGAWSQGGRAGMSTRGGWAVSSSRLRGRRSSDAPCVCVGGKTLSLISFY